MGHEKLRIADIRYNPEREGFEALVALHADGMIFTYPTFTAAPLNAAFTLISRALSAAAMRAHRSDRPGLRMRLEPVLPENRVAA